MEAQKPPEREKEAGGDTAVKVGGKAVDFAKIDIPHAFEILKVTRCSRAQIAACGCTSGASVKRMQGGNAILHIVAAWMQLFAPRSHVAWLPLHAGQRERPG